tara:strand:- start:29 stop:964 length:936 start_codon:yes stop_codon:yes gene_type:complete
MANPISNWLYTGAAPGTQAATQAAAQTTPWGQVGKQVLAEGGYGFGSNNKGFDPKYTGKGATKNPLKYTYEGAKSFGAKVPGNIGGGTPAGRLAFEKLLQSPLARGVGTVGRLATGPIGAAITAAMTGAQLGDLAYKNWEPATKFGNWAGGGIYDLLNPEETSIDPTGKNLFTQYYEDDPYAGIEGQTAMLGLPQLLGMFKAGMSKKQIMKKVLVNQLKEEAAKKIRKKVKPIITGVLTGGQAQAADQANIQKIQQYTGRPVSDYRMSRPASERQFTGHGKSGMGRDKSKLMAYGGRAGYFDGGLLSLWPR